MSSPISKAAGMLGAFKALGASRRTRQGPPKPQDASRTTTGFLVTSTVNTSDTGGTVGHGPRLELDPALYDLTPEEKAFFEASTGIHDAAALKKHILDCQAKAYAVQPYPCIRLFQFLRLWILEVPGYEALLKMGRERPDALFVEFGACFGQELRRAIYDGFPLDKCVATDLNANFWDLSYALFNSTPATFPVPLVPADVLSDTALPLAPPLATGAPAPAPRPDLPTLKSLAPLRGHVTAMHAAAFFHLFDEATQARIARKFAGLLSPAPGSILFGDHVGAAQKGVTSMAGWTLFCHSPASWAALWDGDVFPKGTVRVDAFLKQRPMRGMGPDGSDVQVPFLHWCVTRV